jgi:hypothetical protein
MRPHGLAVRLGSQHRLAVPMPKPHGCLGGGQIEAKANAVDRGAAGEGEQGNRQGNRSDLDALLAEDLEGTDKGDDHGCNRAELLGINDEASGGKQGQQPGISAFFF